MATVEGDGGPGHSWRGGDRGRGRGGGRGGHRGRGPGGGRVDDRGRWRDGGGGDDRGRPPTGHAAAGDAASGVPQVASSSRLPSDGPGATSMVQTESPEPRHMIDGGNAPYNDVDIEKMRMYIQELELKNAELNQKLQTAQAQLREGSKYTNSDPLIEEELRKCHDVFLCQHEGNYKKLSDFLINPKSKLTVDVKPYGKSVLQQFKKLEKDLNIYIPPSVRASRKMAKKFRRMTTVAKYIILGIIEDIYRLHRHGLSLNGKFRLDNFYWTHLKKVKVDPSLKLVVCKRERTGMINDFHQIYQIIVEMLSYHDSDSDVPYDLQSLLDLLNSDDPVKHQEIIRYNISLMSEIGKKCHFIILYDRLQQQILLDKKKGPHEEKISEKVLKYISTHFSKPGGGQEQWATMAKENVYVGLVYDNRSRRKGKILEGPLELLIVWRNALSHVLDGSVKDGVALFKDEDLVNILESAIPNVFSGLQIALSEVGLLELPHLMRAMRM